MTAKAKNENYNRGIALYDKGLYAEAINEFQKVLKSALADNAPEKKLASFYMCEAYANLGLSHLRMIMFSKAEEDIQAALALHPDYPDLHFHLGVVHYKQGDMPSALQSFQKAIELNPKFARAMIYLGMAYLRQGSESGLEEIDKGIKTEPAFKDERYERAMLLYRNGNFDDFLALTEQIAETDVVRIDELIEKGLKFMKSGQYRDAAPVFLEAISVCPHYADLRHYLGLCYLNQDLIDLAVGQFSKSLEINPRFVAARINLAITYDKGGKTERAIEELETVLTIEPGNATALKLISRLQEQT